METAVVILNWNGRKLLEQFLPSVLNFSEEATIYVADNASTDDSVAFLKTNFPGVTIIRNKENGGFAKGYNDALAGLTEDIFILLNSDVQVTKNWLSPIVGHFKAKPATAIVQPKLLDYKNKDYFEYAGAAGGYIDKYGYPYCRGRIFNTIEKDTGQYEDPTPILWASGACLAIRRTVFEKLGGMDELYFAHQEEIDLCWRAHNAGFRAMYLPRSQVYHLGGATLNAMDPQKTFLNFRNSLFNLLKNVPGKNYGRIIFTRLCLDGLAGVKFLARGRPKHTWAIIKAHIDFYKHFGQIRKERPGFPSKTPYFHVKNIVIDYFLRGKRKFSQLH